MGTDGAKSTVRKQLSIPLLGFTWDDYRLVSANIDYDLFKYSNWGPANWIVDSELWAVVAFCGYGTVWRVASAERLDETTKEWNEAAATDRLYQRLAKLLPGPTETAKILVISPYMTHQRCAETFVHGRVVLAGDAAHVSHLSAVWTCLAGIFYIYVDSWKQLIVLFLTDYYLAYKSSRRTRSNNWVSRCLSSRKISSTNSTR